MKNFLLKILIFALLAVSFNNREETIKRLYEPGFSGNIASVIPHITEFNDTIPNDTLFEYRNENQTPAMYSRKVITGVCVDGKCRMVNINLYWTITGRYLGFELPDGEFLSKTEHVKFNPEEYNRLHILLANPQSALANYSLKELVPKKDTSKVKVDAVTSATIAAVLDYIVEGAVYTTYTLWHIVYGPTKREIEKLTAKKMNREIALKLLNGNNLSDKIWVLNHFPETLELQGEIKNKFIEYISGSDIYLAERTLNAIRDNKLNNDLQLDLANVFITAGFLQQRLIIQKLKEAKILNDDVAKKLSYSLPKLNGTLVKITLELFQSLHIDNETVSSNVAMLLENENRYISGQAFRYLQGITKMDKKTSKSFEKYKRKNS